ncbi:MAG: Gx transporter family protein [Chitinispirillales bacterium]|jgi:heptaprenyl diphosphate synthase|nr:Gx transporter family protein [Chitinispirillales bacterium]
MLTNKASIAPPPPNDRDATRKAIWLLAAVALNAVEIAIPRLPFLPWLKPGFANIITVLWIMKYGFGDALLYTALRVWISGFYFGFSLFTLTLSLSGGLLSTAAMFILWTTLGRRGLTGTVGMAIVGALFHNAGQLAVIYMMMSRNIGVLGQIPFMLCAAVVLGGIVGALAPSVGKILGFGIDNGILRGIDTANVRTDSVRIDNVDTDNINTNRVDKNHTKPAVTAKLIIIATFAVSISLMFVNNLYALISAVIIYSLVSFLLNRKNPYVLIYPIRFHTLFLFVAFTNLFLSYGKRLDIIPFVTVDGIFAFVRQSSRLWCWLQTVHILNRFDFHKFFIGLLYRFFPNKKDTLEAGMISLEHFPEVMKLSKSSKIFSVRVLMTNPKAVLTEYVEMITNRIISATDSGPKRHAARPPQN